LNGTERLSRHEARILALSALFCWELTKDEPASVFDRVAESFFFDDEDLRRGVRPSEDHRLAYARELFFSAVNKAPEIDPLIAKASQGWPVSRMPRVDLSLLRLAVAEVAHVRKVPLEVAIDEALEISKQYSTHASPRFVNGVLMGVLREMGYVNDAREV